MISLWFSDSHPHHLPVCSQLPWQVQLTGIVPQISQISLGGSSSCGDVGSSCWRPGRRRSWAGMWDPGICQADGDSEQLLLHKRSLGFSREMGSISKLKQGFGAGPFCFPQDNRSWCGTGQSRTWLAMVGRKKMRLKCLAASLCVFWGKMGICLGSTQEVSK